MENDKTELTTAIEAAITQNDLSKLQPADKIAYYNHVCKSVGLNPLTKPLDYIVLNGKLTLYANKNCAEQLRAIQKISVVEINHKIEHDLAIVTVKLQSGDGRVDAAIGAVNIAGLKGENLCNALMKAETKSKRRATLSLCGMGMLDETEIESIPASAKTIVTDNAQAEFERKKFAKAEPATLADLADEKVISDEPKQPSARDIVNKWPRELVALCAIAGYDTPKKANDKYIECGGDRLELQTVLMGEIEKAGAA